MEYRRTSLIRIVSFWEGIRNLRGIMRGGESSAVTNRHRRCNGVSVARNRVRKTSQRAVGPTRFKANTKQQWARRARVCGPLQSNSSVYQTKPAVSSLFSFCHCRRISSRIGQTDRNDFLAAVDKHARD